MLAPVEPGYMVDGGGTRSIESGGGGRCPEWVLSSTAYIVAK